MLHLLISLSLFADACLFTMSFRDASPRERHAIDFILAAAAASSSAII